jgi:hypothetical protein
MSRNPEMRGQRMAGGLDQVAIEEPSIIALKRQLNALCEKTGLEDIEVLYLIRKSAASVPVEVLASPLAPLESLVLYLRESQGQRLCDIARKLGRDQRVIGVTYSNAKRRRHQMIIPQKSSLLLPLAIFRSERLSVLEATTLYLKEKRGLALSRIALLLDKDPSTIWTALHRAYQKMGARR